MYPSRYNALFPTNNTQPAQTNAQTRRGLLFTSVRSSSLYPDTQIQTPCSPLLEARQARRAAQAHVPIQHQPTRPYAPSVYSPTYQPVFQPPFLSRPPEPSRSVIQSITRYSSRNGAPPVAPHYTRVDFSQPRPVIPGASGTLTLEQTRTVRTQVEIEADTSENKGKARGFVVDAIADVLSLPADRVQPHIPAGVSQVSDLITAVLVAENLVVPNLLDMATLVERVINILE